MTGEPFRRDPLAPWIENYGDIHDQATYDRRVDEWRQDEWDHHVQLRGRALADYPLTSEDGRFEPANDGVQGGMPYDPLPTFERILRWGGRIPKPKIDDTNYCPPPPEPDQSLELSSNMEWREIADFIERSEFSTEAERQGIRNARPLLLGKRWAVYVLLILGLYAIPLFGLGVAKVLHLSTATTGLPVALISWVVVGYVIFMLILASIVGRRTQRWNVDSSGLIKSVSAGYKKRYEEEIALPYRKAHTQWREGRNAYERQLELETIASEAESLKRAWRVRRPECEEERGLLFSTRWCAHCDSNYEIGGGPFLWDLGFGRKYPVGPACTRAIARLVAHCLD